MTVKLEFLTTDPEAMQLAVRYWAMSEAGEFLEKVIDLVPFRHIAKSGSLAAHVRELCTAYDDNLRCPRCNEGLEVKSRSCAKKYPQKSYRPCGNCQALQAAREQAQKAAAIAKLEGHMTDYISRLPSEPIDYAHLGDDLAFLTVALDFAITPRLGAQAFTISDCQALAPMDLGLFIDKMKIAGVLREDPRRAMPGTYSLHGDVLMVRTHAIAYALTPDIHFGLDDEARSILLTREFSDSAALFTLWIDFAAADSMRYLLDQCKTFDHELNERQLNEIRSSLRGALETHSISQIWFVIWKNIKDAAALAKLVYYTDERAAATIPGKIRRTLEKIEKEKTVVSKWKRPEQQPSGTLGMLFNELFGIDEDTPGNQVLTHITAAQPHHDGTDAAMPEAEPVRRLLYEALMNDSGPEMLAHFAELIREGHQVAAVVSKMLGDDVSV
jgi:hypothetical protein